MKVGKKSYIGHNKFMIEKSVSTSKNQSYSEKKRGRPSRSETAPSAMGIDPILPPLNKSVRRLLALSSRFLLDFFLSVLIDWHLHSTQTRLKTYIKI